MNYRCELMIDAPIDTVAALFADPDKRKAWQPTLQSMTLLNGEAHKAGARYKLVFDEGNRGMEMVETIVKHDLPQAFSSTYETANVHNTVENHFESAGPNKTRWVMDNKFQFSGYMRILAFLMRTGTFRNQTMKSMEMFKQYVERSVR
ncbi:MAG: hypothetical protein OHK0046_04330 [Anaerolineae bacterium]